VQAETNKHKVDKIDNSKVVEKVLHGTELSDKSIELILDSINHMHDKI